VKARPPKLETDAPKDDAGASGLASVCADSTGEGIDFSLLEDSLAKTPWERMLANDDALQFADSLRAAVEKRNAKSERIDAETH
jgi:hypothetical protein